MALRGSRPLLTSVGLDFLHVLLGTGHLCLGGWDQGAPPGANVVVEVNHAEVVLGAEIVQDGFHGFHRLGGAT